MESRIVPFAEAHEEAVRAFNQRLCDGGRRERFPDSLASLCFPRLPGRQYFREHYLALDGDSVVRGAYILQHQDFRAAGQTVAFGYLGLPISEGIVDRRYATLGVRLLLDALERQSLLYGLGHGGFGEAIARLLKAGRWHIAAVPFFFRIVHPFAFLREVAYLRKTLARRTALDALAFTGAGWLGVKAVQRLRYAPARPDPSVTAELAPEFGPWADGLWDRCRDEYGLCAVRDQATLAILYPREETRFLRLKVLRGDRLIGWTVALDTPLANHKQFGNMRLGSIVDCLASPGDAAAVIDAAAALLAERGVDLMVSNQAHGAWCAAMKRAGFIQGPSNFLFSSSPELTRLRRSRGIDDRAMHWNRGDGDGPINL